MSEGIFGENSRSSNFAPGFPRAIAFEPEPVNFQLLTINVQLNDIADRGSLYRFAMSRPREERVTARETKRLIRRAMRGILPDAFLAPRPQRTGVTTQYMREAMRGPARALFDDAFRRPLLAELGIVDATRLQEEWRRYAESGEGLGLRLFELLQTELWLRSHTKSDAGASEPVVATPVAVS